MILLARSISVLLLLELLSFTASAQITVTYKAYKALVDDGYAYCKTDRDSGKIFDLGTIGGKDNVYDITQFHYTVDPLVIKTINPANTPYAKLFKSTTHCRVRRVKEGETKDYYQYYRLAKDGYYLLGVSTESYKPGEEYRETPPLPLIKLPLSFKSSWDYRSEPVKMEHVESGTRQLEHHVKVIAAGTLKTPAWTKPCLVMKGERIIIAKTPKSTDTTGSMWYEFIAKDGTSARIDIDRAEAHSKTPHILSASYTKKLKK